MHSSQHLKIGPSLGLPGSEEWKKPPFLSPAWKPQVVPPAGESPCFCLHGFPVVYPAFKTLPFVSENLHSIQAGFFPITRDIPESNLPYLLSLLYPCPLPACAPLPHRYLPSPAYNPPSTTSALRSQCPLLPYVTIHLPTSEAHFSSASTQPLSLPAGSAWTIAAL